MPLNGEGVGQIEAGSSAGTEGVSIPDLVAAQPTHGRNHALHRERRIPRPRVDGYPTYGELGSDPHRCASRAAQAVAEGNSDAVAQDGVALHEGHDSVADTRGRQDQGICAEAGTAMAITAKAYSVYAASPLSYKCQLLWLPDFFFKTERTWLSKLLRIPHYTFGIHGPFNLTTVGLADITSLICYNIASMARAALRTFSWQLSAKALR